MKRNLKKLQNEEFDVLIVGAGIYGVAATWDAALRGLKVALIDQGDYGNATSSNSLKTIHGGLRYLQSLDFKRMRESIRERMILMYIAPHLVHPLPVIMPTYSYKLKSRLAMSAALLANDLVGIDRNRLKDPHKYMPGGRTMSKKKLKEAIPGYEKYNLNGGALWYDCQCYSTERLLLSFVISADRIGATVANYVKATGFLKSGRNVIGIKAEDALTGEVFDIRSRIVLNMGGPWVDRILAGLNGKPGQKKFQLSSAMNIVVNRDIMGEFAGGLSGPYRHVFEDGREYNAHRILFFVPWRKKTIIGTNHLPYSGKLEDYKVSEGEIESFLAAVNKAHPAANIKRDEVTFFYGGFLPMTGTNSQTGEVQLQKHYQLCDHSLSDGIDGLITVVGVKYTTARDVSEKSIDLVFRKLNQKTKKSSTDKTRLYGGEIDRFADFVDKKIAEKTNGFSDSIITHLCYHYGSAYMDIMKYEKEEPNWMKTMPDSPEVLKAEIVHGVREEMALKLSDVILRRTDLGAAKHPGEAALKEAAQLMSKELGWSQERMEQEIKEVQKIYLAA